MAELEELKERIDAVEEAYEFFLAYAAQGLPGDEGSSSGQKLRDYLQSAAASLSGLADLWIELVEVRNLEPADDYRAMGTVLEQDTDKAGVAIRLVLAQPSISSQLVDNLNASIHLRAVLTDLFLVDDLLSGT